MTGARLSVINCDHSRPEPAAFAETPAGDCPAGFALRSGGISRSQRAIHQTADKRLTRLLVVIPDRLFRQ